MCSYHAIRLRVNSTPHSTLNLTWLLLSSLTLSLSVSVSLALCVCFCNCNVFVICSPSESRCCCCYLPRMLIIRLVQSTNYAPWSYISAFISESPDSAHATGQRRQTVDNNIEYDLAVSRYRYRYIYIYRYWDVHSLYALCCHIYLAFDLDFDSYSHSHSLFVLCMKMSVCVEM